MKRLLEGMRVYILSPELAAIVATFAVNQAWPAFFEMLGQTVKSSATGIEAGLFFAILAPALLTYKWSDDILNPSDKTVLTGWPEYWRLKNRVWASLVFCGVAAVCWMGGILAISMNGSVRWGAASLVVGGLVALICTATVGIARLMIKEVLAGE